MTRHDDVAHTLDGLEEATAALVLAQKHGQLSAAERREAERRIADAPDTLEHRQEAA